MQSPVEYLAIGHVTRDLLPDASYAVGGTVSYAALTAAALCRSVGVVTSASGDFDLSVFNGAVEVKVEPAAVTTTFRNEYTNGYREQVVYGLAKPLTPTSLPDDWRAPSIVHIGPVIGECDPALALAFPEETFVGITPQGWMRSQNGTGQVVPNPWEVSGELLERASAIVFSLDDIQGDWRVAESLASATHLLVVTMGPLGGVLFVDGTPTPFSALQVDEVDPTGAGDIFAAAFFSATAVGVLPCDAARFAACIASRSVTRAGIRGVPSPEDLAYCRDL